LLQEGFRKATPLMHSTRDIKDKGEFISTNVRKTKVTFNTVYRTKVWYSVEPSYLSNLSQMGLLNPAEVAWELTPWSFVVDWFVPVGNVLEALTARVGVTFIDGFTSWKVESTYEDECIPSGNVYGPVVVNTQRMYRHNRGFERSKLTSFPVPGFYYKSPFSSKHALNALALLRQLIR